MRIYKEEIFGPVLCVVRVADFASALVPADSHEYGTARRFSVAMATRRANLRTACRSA